VETVPHSDAFAATPELHPDLGEVAFLLGTWRGEGEGEWPSTEPFRYGEEVAVEDVGDNYLVYTHRSWSLDDGSPVHLERGFVRPAGPGRVELVLAHPLGITEIAEGTVADGVLEVASTVVGLTTTAGPVTELRRRIEVRGDAMVNETHMAMRDVLLMSHVRARLGRVTSG
jgi:hypothetical protein